MSEEMEETIWEEKPDIALVGQTHAKHFHRLGDYRILDVRDGPSWENPLVLESVADPQKYPRLWKALAAIQARGNSDMTRTFLTMLRPADNDLLERALAAEEDLFLLYLRYTQHAKTPVLDPVEDIRLYEISVDEACDRFNRALENAR